MRPFPHHYSASLEIGAGDSFLVTRSPGLPGLEANAPAEFDGPGDRWSPETLLMAAVADCFALGFRAIAAASNLPWRALSCEVTGTLDRVDKVTRFTSVHIRAGLTIPADAEARARRILQKAKDTCLVSNSLVCEVGFDAETTFE